MSVVRLIYARQNARSWRGNIEEARYRPHIQKVYGVVGYMDKKTVPCTESEEFCGGGGLRAERTHGRASNPQRK